MKPKKKTATLRLSITMAAHRDVTITFEELERIGIQEICKLLDDD